MEITENEVGKASGYQLQPVAQHHHLPPCHGPGATSLSSSGLVTAPAPWAAHPTLCGKEFLLLPNPNPTCCTWGLFPLLLVRVLILFCHLAPGSRAQPSPGCSCRCLWRVRGSPEPPLLQVKHPSSPQDLCSSPFPQWAGSGLGLLQAAAQI